MNVSCIKYFYFLLHLYHSMVKYRQFALVLMLAHVMCYFVLRTRLYRRLLQAYQAIFMNICSTHWFTVWSLFSMDQLNIFTVLARIDALGRLVGLCKTGAVKSIDGGGVDVFELVLWVKTWIHLRFYQKELSNHKLILM